MLRLFVYFADRKNLQILKWTLTPFSKAEMLSVGRETSSAGLGACFSNLKFGVLVEMLKDSS